MRLHLTLLALVITIAACLPTAVEPVEEATSTEADVEAIKQLPAKFAAALNAGDLDGIMVGFTDDAVRMPPNAPAIIGKESIRSLMQANLDQNTYQLDNPPEEVQVSGDWAFARGTYTVTVTPKAGGESIQLEGKYLVVCQKQPDGSWKAARDIWNSDNPAPGQ